MPVHLVDLNVPVYGGEVAAGELAVAHRQAGDLARIEALPRGLRRRRTLRGRLRTRGSIGGGRGEGCRRKGRVARVRLRNGVAVRVDLLGRKWSRRSVAIAVRRHLGQTVCRRTEERVVDASSSVQGTESRRRCESSRLGHRDGRIRADMSALVGIEGVMLLLLLSEEGRVEWEGMRRARHQGRRSGGRMEGGRRWLSFEMRSGWETVHVVTGTRGCTGPAESRRSATFHQASQRATAHRLEPGGPDAQYRGIDELSGVVVRSLPVEHPLNFVAASQLTHTPLPTRIPRGSSPA